MHSRDRLSERTVTLCWPEPRRCRPMRRIEIIVVVIVVVVTLVTIVAVNILIVAIAAVSAAVTWGPASINSNVCSR